MNLFQGENSNFYLTFLDGNSAPINTGVSGSTIDIYHFMGSTLAVDVSSGTMIQQNSPYANIWYYNYQVPVDAVLTTYNVVYNAFISGISYQTTDNFNVVPPSSGSAFINPGGSVNVSGVVVDPSGNAISNVAVLFASGASFIGSTVTNASGSYSSFLNPATYYTTFTAEGYYTNQISQVVPSGSLNFNFGETTLVPQTYGPLIISDTYVTTDVYGNPIPLVNLKVTLWSIDTVAGGQPIEVVYTNTSGTFAMSSYPGNFILQVIGQDPFYQRYNQTRNIEVNAVYTPNNFQYGDTSSYSFL